MARRFVIIGNGVAGVTAAMTLRERDPDAEVVVVSAESPYFFSRTALMYALMGALDRRDMEPFERKVYRERRITLLHDRVTDLDASARTITTEKGQTLAYDGLLLATGSVPRKLDVPGLEARRDGVVSFVSMQDLDACERFIPSTREAVVVGGGLIGIELVECLVHHGVRTTFLVREPWYWPVALAKQEAELVTAHMRERGVDVRLDSEVARVDHADGRVSAVTTKSGEKLPCQTLGVAIGVEPGVAWMRSVKTPPSLGRGVRVDATLKTSLDHVWSAGDCAEIDLGGERPLIEQIWYSAKRQGALAAHNMTGRASKYAPPIFFNSAKFFDVEFTTVGDLTRAPADAKSLFRKHRGARVVTQRIVHHEGKVIGFNMLGSRWDHTVLTQWIDAERSLEWTLANLHLAQFDVEFGRANLRAMTEEEGA